MLPAVQHGSGVGEADEHVLSAVQPVQLVPNVVRGHGGGGGRRTDRAKFEAKDCGDNYEESPSLAPSPSFLSSLSLSPESFVLSRRSTQLEAD